MKPTPTREKCEQVVALTKSKNPRICQLMDVVVPNMTGKDVYTFVETGVFQGDSSRYFIARMILAGKQVSYHAIDNFQFDNMRDQRGELVDYEKQYKDLMAEYGMENIYVHKMDAKEGPALFDDGEIDFIMIDDLHERNHLEWEVKQYAPKIASGGVMSVDDMNSLPLRDAVYKAVGQEYVRIIDGCVAYVMQENLKG